MFDFNNWHKELLNLDWTGVGWNCLGIGCMLMHLSKFFKIGPWSQVRVSAYDENTTETNAAYDENTTETNELIQCDLV